MVNKSSIYVNTETGDRLRAIAQRENRQIIAVLDRMLDIYEDLTIIDHAVIADMAKILNLTPGQAVSHMVQTFHNAGIRTPMPRVTEATG